MNKNLHYKNVVMPIREETRFLNGKDHFPNPSKDLQTILECVAIHFPNGISTMLIPAMTDSQIKSLPFLELYDLSKRAHYLICTGYWKFFNYSESYLDKIRSEARKQYEKISSDKFQVRDETGKVIAKFGIIKGKYFGPILV